MSIRTGINSVNCTFDATCGAIIEATDINSINDGGKAALNRGRDVVNLAGMGQINLFDEPQTPVGELDVSKKILEFENCGESKYVFGCKFRLDDYATSGTRGASNIKVIYVQHTGAEITLMDVSVNTSVYPTSTSYSSKTIHRVEGTGTIAAIPAVGESEWHKIRVEYYIPQAANWDKDFMNDYGVSWLYLKLYDEC